MGRESDKARRRRLERKAEKGRVAAAANLVKEANAIPDLMTEMPAFQRYERRGVAVRVEHRDSGAISDAEMDALLALCRTNMSALYDSCEWGWSDKEKRCEMTESMAKFLIVRDSEDAIVAFCHFRFDLDYGDDVLYCYEIQLSRPYQRCGLGKFLMMILELLAFKKQMLFVRLTVLNHNEQAKAFFKSCGYVRDKTCLESTIHETFCYEILSKKNPRKEDTNMGHVPEVSVHSAQKQ